MRGARSFPTSGYLRAHQVAHELSPRELVDNGSLTLAEEHGEEEGGQQVHPGDSVSDPRLVVFASEVC